MGYVVDDKTFIALMYALEKVCYSTCDKPCKKCPLDLPNKDKCLLSKVKDIYIKQG